ncbi:MAG: lytic transglycosylase domain-containing protein [Chitinophagaceae bacterium]|nr:lytic transglycosylase domain-containing protein [Chitinophagaceae bacterium]
MKAYRKAGYSTRSVKWLLILFIAFFTLSGNTDPQHNVYFCGDRIPVDREFVRDKLMNVIRRQVPVVNLPTLRKRADMYFPIVEKFLLKYGIPEDLKYLPIVESGFISNATSRVGAHGFWQIMPKTGVQYGLVMNDVTDERTDIYKASEVGCKLLRDNYNYIKKFHGVASWSLAAAAYNFGIGNITKTMKKQGSDYFAMQLNPETALYVYKIIAVKELFEYPELYMKNFGYNVFSTAAPKKMKEGGDDSDAAFAKINLEVSTQENKSLEKPARAPKYLVAHIEGKHKDFKDGNLIKIVLDEDLTTGLGFSRKGYSFSVQGWIINDRVYMDLGYGHEITLFDANLKKGIELNELKSKRVNILLKNTGYSD